jgi:hypothetical protein
VPDELHTDGQLVRGELNDAGAHERHVTVMAAGVMQPACVLAYATPVCSVTGRVDSAGGDRFIGVADKAIVAVGRAVTPAVGNFD